MKTLFLETYLLAIFFAAALASPNNEAEGCIDQGDGCLSGLETCNNKCGCDRLVAYYYNATLDECTLDVRALMLSLVEKYNIGEKLQIEADKIFQGIKVSAILIVACAVIGVLFSCFYCFRMNYYDYKLKKDVKALSHKLGRDKMRKISTKVKTEPKAESCNVVVEDAGLFVC